MSIQKLVTVLDTGDILNNVLASLSLDIDEVFFVYRHQEDYKHTIAIKKIIRKYKKIKIHIKKIRNADKEIEKILNDNEGIIVDIGGEKYLSLVLFDKALNRNNEIIYYDNEENKIKSYREHKVLIEDVFKLSIEDLLELNGGKITRQMHHPINNKDRESVEVLYKTMTSSFNDYSKFTSFIQKINSAIARKDSRNGRNYLLNKDEIQRIKTDESFNKYKEIGLINIIDNELIFPTRAIGKLFEVTGSFLENYLYLLLTSCNEFDDVMMSVVVDFSGDLRAYPIVCEIDCMIIKNNHLLFVSCKSNKVDTDDLNEIKVHNTMFGNDLSAPVLCTLDDLNIKSPSVYGKAKELGVAIVDTTAFKHGLVVDKFLDIINNNFKFEELG